ncbi:MAG TPA: sulfite exporter TauE/SafE family protein [bacterium]|nr:sulfite exporter TauE/SafE family protein [bacterium]
MTLHLWQLAIVMVTALFSGVLGSAAGTGGTAVLLPVLVLFFGIQQAVPIVTIANLSANVGRVVFNRKELDLPVVGWFTLGCLPFTIAGTILFTISAPAFLTRVMGLFLIAIVLWRHLRPTVPQRHSPRWFLPVGAGFGFLSGFMTGTGPLVAPFYLAYGLVKGAYIGTDALATVIMQSTKLAVFGHAQFLGRPVLVNGLLLVPFMVAGAWLGKRMLDLLPERFFAIVIELTILMAGVGFVLRG